MKSALRVLGYAVALFVAIPIFCRLADWLPFELSTLGCVAFAIGAAWPKKHNADSQAIADDIEAALADIGMSSKEAAYLQGISESQFSSQRAGRETLNASRLASVGRAFRIAWATRMLKREGIAVLHDDTLADLLTELRALIALGRKREVA